jgi:hypothetical protein
MLTLVVLTVSGAPARGQTAGAVILVGYGALSVGALVKLKQWGPVTPGSGSVIRARGIGERYVVGRITQLDTDSITVETDSITRVTDSVVTRQRIARSDIRQMQVNIGTSRRWAVGWGIGLLSGAITGGVIGSASGSDKVFTKGENTLLGVIGGGMLGSLAGAFVGMVSPQEWVGASGFGQPSRVGVSPLFGTSTGLSARVRF